MRRGQSYLDAGNLDKASIEFRNASQIEPKESEPLYLNGRVAEARGNIREALSLYQAAVEANYAATPARAHLGKLLVFAGAAQSALDTVAPGIQAHPDDVDLLAVRAAARHQLKDDDAARADAERAVQLSPANENAVAALVAIDAASKDYPKAIAVVTHALELAPKSIELREVLTNLFLQTSQPEKAEAQMRKIIELRPTDLAPRSQLALHFARTHNLDAAQQVLEETVQAFAKSKDKVNADAAKLLLVDFIAGERSREQGEKTLSGFIAQEPDNLDLRLGLGALLQRTGAAQEALAAYQEVVKRDGTGPKGLLARDRVAAIEVSRGQAEAARKTLAEVLQKNPRDDDALVLRATLEMQANDPTAAIADLRAVMRDQPNSIPLQRTLAGAYIAKGEPALAEETLRAALQAAPNDVGVRIDLAQLLAKTDRAADGITLLQETVTRLPDNLPAREALIKAYLAKNDFDAARSVAGDLETRQPKSAAGFYYAGLIAAQDKHLEESERNLQQALLLQPRDVQVLSALSRVEVARGSYDQAISTVRAAVDQGPDSLPLLDLLAALYFERKDYAHAGEIYLQESVLMPRLWQAHRNLARVKLATDDVAGAAHEYEAALKMAPVEPQLVQEAATLHEKQGRVDEAIRDYETLYKGNPRTQQFAANNLAMLLVTYKTDRASLDRARDLTSSFASSDNGNLLDTAGWVRFKRGEYRDASMVLLRALQRMPESKVVRYHLGMAELQLGERDQARSNLESALSGSDSFSGADEARVALATLKDRSG